MSTFSNAQASVEFLSAADDLLTGLLLDRCIFDEPREEGRATGKINLYTRALRSRGDADQEVDDVRQLVKKLRKGTISLTDALDTLLQLPTIHAFNQKWGDEPLFANHARRYIVALRPDSGISFHETDRYTNPCSTAALGQRNKGKKKALPEVVAANKKKDPSQFIEVGVFATRAFKKGEVVNLRGGVADLTDEQDDELRGERGRSEFSVLWSERKNCFCLLLGPARFVNHCCRNNVEFQLQNHNMTFKVLEDIAKDEELFTHYGDHYFERDNAGCLCTTCEQLERGAFAPAAPPTPKAVKQPKPKPAARRPSSPTAASRRSGRAVATVNYNEEALVASTSSASGHALTAQRSLRAGLSRSSSLSSLSSSALSSPKRPVKERAPPSRVAPSRISAIDALRAQPRTVVQPKLPPPPGYRGDYVWDSRKKTAKYVGPTICPVDETSHKRKPSAAPAGSGLTRSTSAPSRLNLKRTRSASDSPAPSPKPKRPRNSQVQLKAARRGERSSSRIHGGSASARDRTFARLRQALGGDEDGDESELSELEDSSEVEEPASELSEVEESDEERAAEEEEAREVAELLSPAGVSPRRPQAEASTSAAAQQAASSTASVENTSITVTTQRTTRSSRSATSELAAAPLRSVAVEVGMSTSTPIEESLSPNLRCSSPDEAEDQIVLVPVPAKVDGAGSPLASPRPSTPRRPIGTPSFYSASRGAADSAGQSGAGKADGRATAGPMPSFCEARPSEGGGNPRLPTGVGPGGGGGGGGGGGDDERDRERRRALPVDKTDVDLLEKEEEEEEEQKPVGLSDDGQGKGRSAPASEEQVADSNPEDAAAALLMLLSAPLPTSARSPLSTAPTPPQTDSSAASTSADAVSTSSSHPSEAARAATNPRADLKGKRKRVSDADGPRESPQPSANPRSTRRHSKLESPAPEPVADSSKSKGKKRRVSPSPAPPSPAGPSASTSQRRSSVASRSSAAANRTSEAPSPAVEARRTRSKPLPGKLEDVLYAPETLAALGGFDWEKGRYISKHEALRDPSNDPRPPPREESSSPSPPPSPRPSSSRPAFAPPKPKGSGNPPRRPRMSDSPAVSTSRHAAASSRSPANPPSRRSSLAASPAVNAVLPEGVRSTRKSFPMAGVKVEDLIYGEAARNATGGWDPVRKMYVSAANASAAATASPSQPAARRTSSASSVLRPPPSSVKASRTSSGSPAALPSRASAASAPPDGTRSTRRSYPMAGVKVADLVYGDAARSATGGWDPVAGKYVAAGKPAAGPSGSGER
ncbi:hypothetical protein JCM10207_005980 [Rhodosporidiobolus poonsookiae]